MRNLRSIVLAALLACAVTASTPDTPPAEGATTITMSGSTSVYPLAAALARSYASSSGTRFRIVQGGSDVGVADAGAGRVTLGMSSRDPKGGDPGGIVFHRIARDALCLVVNNANSLANLNRSQVQALYSGQVTKFPNGRAVALYARTAPSGTQDAFQKLFLDPLQQSTVVRLVASSGLMTVAVRNNANALGYESLGFVRGIKALNYNGVSCSLRNAQSGTYPGSRNLYLVSRGRPTAAAAGFIKFIRTSPAARAIVARNYVPLR